MKMKSQNIVRRKKGESEGKMKVVEFAAMTLKRLNSMLESLQPGVHTYKSPGIKFNFSQELLAKSWTCLKNHENPKVLYYSEEKVWYLKNKLDEFVRTDRTFEIAVTGIAAKIGVTIANLSEELVQSKEKCLLFETENNKLFLKFCQLNARVGQLRNELDVSEKKNEKQRIESERIFLGKDNEVKIVENKLKTEEEKNYNLLKDVENMKKQLKQISSEEQDSKMKLKSLREKLSNLQKETKTASEDSKKMYESLSKAKLQLINKAKEIESLKLKNLKLIDQNKSLEKSIIEKDQKIGKFIEKIENKKSIGEAIGTQTNLNMQELYQKINKLAEAEEHQGEVSALKEDLLKIKNDKEELITQCFGYKTKLNDLNMEKLALKRELEFLRSSNVSTTIRMNKLKDTYKTLQKANASLEHKVLNILLEVDESEIGKSEELRNKLKSALKEYIIAKQSICQSYSDVHSDKFKLQFVEGDNPKI
ncbi:uncharacterized protein MCAP_0864-like [Prorops nasuta]|uniref:uncharacterized protein MCAP_0864-like n=1 Tax=Prorops nasuta TaxID=863751 RepID=UPI0034CE8238